MMQQAISIKNWRSPDFGRGTGRAVCMDLAGEEYRIWVFDGVERRGPQFTTTDRKAALRRFDEFVDQ